MSSWSTVKCPLCLLHRLLRASITFFPSGVPRLSKVKEKNPIGLVSGLCSRRHCLYVIAQFHYSWAKSKVFKWKKVTRARALQGRYLRVDSIKYLIITYENLISWKRKYQTSTQFVCVGIVMCNPCKEDHRGQLLSYGNHMNKGRFLFLL